MSPAIQVCRLVLSFRSRGKALSYMLKEENLRNHDELSVSEGLPGAPSAYVTSIPSGKALTIPSYGVVKYDGFKDAEPPPDITMAFALPPTMAIFLTSLVRIGRTAP